MKTELQSNPDLSLVCEMIEDISIAMLTNKDDRGALTSRPMSPLEIDKQGVLWFFIDDRTAASGEQLKLVNLSFSDEERSIYVSISGRGEIDKDRARMKRLWTSFAKPWFPEGPDSPHLALLKVIPETAEYWDGPHSKMVRSFAMAASIAAGKPLGLGEHDTLTNLSKGQAKSVTG